MKKEVNGANIIALPVYFVRRMSFGFLCASVLRSIAWMLETGNYEALRPVLVPGDVLHDLGHRVPFLFVARAKADSRVLFAVLAVDSGIRFFSPSRRS